MRTLGLVVLLIAINFAAAIPSEMLVIGGIHHYWHAIPALGYGALFFISILISVIVFFYTLGKGIAELIEE